MANVKTGKEFKPEIQFKSYNLIFTSLTVISIILLCTVWFIFPISEFLPEMAMIYIAAIIILPLAFIIYWNPLYYRSIVYRLDSEEMSWKRGVWFRQTGIVPYNRITNVDIVQGPLMRYYKISDLKIQTAGYSGQKNSEIAIKGIDNPEEIRDLILDYVRNRKPQASVTGGDENEDKNTDYNTGSSTTGRYSGDSTGYSGRDLNMQMLTELKEIRKLLEEKSGR
ncbi:PH domain-containing protein [Methanoplanus endosymbiosus]|uniref:PH domain-containing protein n=1 Tax=Methanoplanus endosymbiosus TaxID=33865 RepID=A0A9E7TH20_9EURY|nr:PH domain-containing protein [Methanoplanus endosymbiosus]UUX92052.1 PH domain-containing protein [Methanoplanus endosymbiosus]